MPSGYTALPSLNPQATTFLSQLFPQIQGLLGQSAQGYQQFLPGGGGGQPIIDQAMQQFQQKTVPSILNAFGSESGRGSSALNQALASSGANLNTDLAAKLAEMQLQAAGGLGSLGLGGAQTGLANSGMSYMQKQPGFLKQLLLSLLGGAGQIGGGLAQGWAGGRF